MRGMPPLSATPAAAAPFSRSRREGFWAGAAAVPALFNNRSWSAGVMSLPPCSGLSVSEANVVSGRDVRGRTRSDPVIVTDDTRSRRHGARALDASALVDSGQLASEGDRALR